MQNVQLVADVQLLRRNRWGVPLLKSACGFPKAFSWPLLEVISYGTCVSVGKYTRDQAATWGKCYECFPAPSFFKSQCLQAYLRSLEYHGDHRWPMASRKPSESSVGPSEASGRPKASLLGNMEMILLGLLEAGKAVGSLSSSQKASECTWWVMRWNRGHFVGLRAVQGPGLQLIDGSLVLFS